MRGKFFLAEPNNSDHQHQHPKTYPTSLFHTTLGVTFPARYLGFVALAASPNELSEKDKTLFTTECTALVREAQANSKNLGQVIPRKLDQQFAHLYQNPMNISVCEEEVALISVTAERLALILCKKPNVNHVQHSLRDVSFVCVSEDGKFSSYVCETAHLGRLCVVLESDCSFKFGLAMSQVSDFLFVTFILLYIFAKRHFK